MSNQPNEAAIRRYRVIAVSHDQCVNTHGVSAIEDAAGALVYYGDHDAVVTRLRSALADAEKALLVIGERAVCDFDDATVGDVDRVVTDHMKYKDWLRSVMTAATERDALAAQLAEAEKRADEWREWANSAFIERNDFAARLAEARWIPVAERMPEPDEPVLLWWRPINGNPYGEAAVIGSISRHEQGNWWNPQTASYQGLWHITHWRPLPPPPPDSRRALANKVPPSDRGAEERS